jgi:hypothetical protein
VNLTWRDAFYRRWIYYTITPQIQFPKEDEYEARPSIRFGWRCTRRQERAICSKSIFGFDREGRTSYPKIQLIWTTRRRSVSP